MLICRFFLFLFGLMCSTFSLAGEGFYIGVGATSNQVDSSVKYNNTISTSPPAEADYINEESDMTNAGGKVAGGYQWLLPLQDVLASFAVEGYANFWSESVEVSSPEVEVALGRFNSAVVDYKFQNTYGITAKPGIFITNNLSLVGQIGLDYMQVRDIELDKGPNYTNPPGNARFESFGNKSLWGLRLGAGLQYLVTKQLTVEGAWAYTFFTDDVLHESFAISANTTADLQIENPNMNQFTLMLNYYFN